MACAKSRAKRYGSPRPYDTLSVQVQAIARARAPRPRGRRRGATCPSRRRRSSGRPPRAPTGGPVSACVGSGPSRSRRPTSGSSGVARWAPRPVKPGLPGQREEPDHRRLATQHDRTAVVHGRGGRGRRARSPRRAGSRPAGRAAWIRAAVVIASPVTARSPVPSPRAAATTSPVARPIRTSSGSPPSSGSQQHRPDLERRERRPDRVVIVGRGASRRPRRRRRR